MNFKYPLYRYMLHCPFPVDNENALITSDGAYALHVAETHVKYSGMDPEEYWCASLITKAERPGGIRRIYSLGITFASGTGQAFEQTGKGTKEVLLNENFARTSKSGSFCVL
jgi:hypothetical protein